MEKYHKRIRDLREDNDLAQKAVAGVLGIAQTTYSQYELGKRPIPLNCIIKLVQYYNVSSDYLLGLTDEK